MLMSEVLELLNRLGVSSRLRGSQFLAYAVTLCVQDESYLRADHQALPQSCTAFFNYSSKYRKKHIFHDSKYL